MEFEKGISHLGTFDASCISLDANLDSSDVFILGGIMNPKELYLKEDGDTDVTTKDSGSSSDSGISGGSALDDLHDIADVTELNSLIDGELKELDFSIDFTLPRLEESSFDPAELLAEIKQEPSSPSPGQNSKQPASPDFFHDPLNEISIKEESAACLSPTNQHHLLQQHQLHSHHVGSSCYQQDVHSYGGYQLQEQQYTVQAAPLSSKNGYIIPSSYQPVSPSSSSSSPPPSGTSVLPLGQNYQQQQQKMFTYSTNSSPAAGKNHGYIVNSNKRRASLNQVVPRPTTAYSTPSVVPVPLNSSASASPPSSGQIDAILNNNIRIQPKPGADLVVSAGNLQWVTTAGNLPSQAGIPVATQQGIPILGSPGSISAITDEKSLKRAQRIIKNRESACLSRKRKKEYMSSLEERLQQCANENERLAKENESLRHQVDLLQKENQELKQPLSTGSAAKKICLMCVAILLTLNLTSISLTGSSSDSLSSLSISGRSDGMDIAHHPSGRSLLGLSDPEVLQNYEDQATSRNSNGDTLRLRSPKLQARLLEEDGILRFDRELNLLAQKLNQTSCSMYFNSTESLRLADELRGWMIRQEEEKQKKKTRARSRTAQSGSDSGSKQQGSATTARQRKQKSYLPVRHFGTSAAYRGEDSVGQHYPMQVFSPGFERQERLLHAIPRRNDTFYVFSFSTDYFLVPATAHNKTARPRMSLLMPVISSSVNESGDTGSTDQVGVMQIDCEILNTNLIHVHRSVFPDSETSTHNASSAHNFETQFYQNGSNNSNFNAESHQNMSSKSMLHTSNNNQSNDVKSRNSHQNMSSKSMLHTSNNSQSNDVKSRNSDRKYKLQDTLKKLSPV